MKKDVKSKKIENSGLVKQTFDFWFNNKETHIRSPFPEYIRSELKRIATQSFHNWINGLSDKAEKEVNDDIISEKFEEIIFEEGLKLVFTEDEKISINYPFLPKINDEINSDDKVERSVIIDRSTIKEGDHTFLVVKLENLEKKRFGKRNLNYLNRFLKCQLNNG